MANPEPAAPPREVLEPEDQVFKVVALEKLHESRTNPRRTFPPQAQADLEASIREKGMIVPIVARPVNGGFEVVAGARRYRAAKKVGLRDVPLLVRELTDKQALEVQVIENLQRADVHPMEEGEGYRQLMEKAGYEVAALARKVGKSASYVYQRLKLADLAAPAKDAFLKDEITAGHAILIARLSPEDQKAALHRCLPDAFVSTNEGGDRAAHVDLYDEIERTGAAPQKVVLPVRSLAKWVADEVHADLKRAPWDTDDASLLPKAGPCRSCPKRTGNCPGLFPEVRKDTTCTDRACFREKLEAWFAREKKALEEAGQKAAFISTEERWKVDEAQEGVKYKGDWHGLGKKKCGSQVVGLVVDGSDRGKTLPVCGAAGCSVHNPRLTYSSPARPSGAGKSPAQLERERRDAEDRERKNRRDGELTVALFRAALDKAPSRPGFPEFQALAAYLSVGDIPAEVTRLYPQFRSYGSHEAAMKKLKARDLVRFVLGFTMSDGYDDVDEHAVLQACKRWKVPVGQVKLSLKKKWDAQDARIAAGRGAGMAGVVELLGPEALGKTKGKPTKPTCGRCGCTKDEACKKHEVEGLAGAEWAVLDRATNHGLCTTCVTVDELGRLGDHAKAAVKPKKPAGGGKSKPANKLKSVTQAKARPPAGRGKKK